jgi:lipopolysaccharide biosynthesis regulator YciM
MSSLAPVATVLLTVFFIPFCNAQDPKLAAADTTSSATAALQGKVLSSDGQPAPGIRVELENGETATPVVSTYTQQDGTFELYNIPRGSYEVVAESGDTQVSDQITVQLGRPKLELRLPPASARPYGAGATVSVAQILVPEKAQKAYRKARQAFTNGKPSVAEPLVEEALLIDPEFAAALTLRGLIAMQKNDLPAAQHDLERAARVDPNFSATFIALGAVYNHEGQYDQALQSSQHGVALAPRSWQGYFEMAKAAIAKGMYEKGLQFAKQAERLGGSPFAGLHLVKAYALVPMKLYKDAKYELQACLSREPKGVNADRAHTLLAELAAADDTTLAAAH